VSDRIPVYRFRFDITCAQGDTDGTADGFRSDEYVFNNLYVFADIDRDLIDRVISDGRGLGWFLVQEMRAYIEAAMLEAAEILLQRQAEQQSAVEVSGE